MPKGTPALCAPAPDVLAGEDAHREFDRPLSRLLERAHGHLAMLLRRGRNRRRFEPIATIAKPGIETDPLACAAQDLLAAQPRPEDGISDDRRTVVRWLRQPEGYFALVVARRADAQPFDSADIAALTESVDWIGDVAWMWWLNRRTEARLEGLRAGFGNRDIGAVLLDGRGCIIEANATARRMMRVGTGLFRTRGRLAAANPDDGARLRVELLGAIIAATEGRTEPPRELAISRPGQSPLLVAIRQAPVIALADDSRDPRLLLLIVDPDAKRDVGGACALHSLTTAQTRLTKKLVDGLSVEEAAAELGLSPQTGRTYLKEIFRRTGVKRQASLIRLLLNSRLPVLQAPKTRRPERTDAER